MNLSNDLVNKFVEITNDETPNKEGSTAYGVTVQYGDRMYVKLDGSDLLTPVETTSAIKSGERVTVLIKDHNATVTGNLSDPSASSKDLTDIGDKIAEVDILIADKVDTEILVAETARIEELIATKASIGQLEADKAEIEYLMANKAEITDLEAINADIVILDAEVADIETLVNGHLTSDNIQSLVLTSDKVTVDDAFIKDAMIDNVNANKITSGQINTSLVSISSEDGSMTLNGSTQQFKDSEGTVRIQIGKDAEGNFTFCLFSQDGVGILLDEEGIHAGAVPDGLIVNDMVADNANISGSKLDINSVITSINNGTTTIDSSRIYLDDESQTLKVAFDSLKTKVETIEETSINGDLSSVMEQITNNTTNINVMQGQISSLISNTTITKENGEVVQLKDEYNSTKDTVDSHTTKIGLLETNVNDISSKQSSMELDLNGFRTEVSNTYATKEEVEIINYNLLSNGKFKNCYEGTNDMIPSWTCDSSGLRVFEPQEVNEFGCLVLYNSSDTTKEIKQKVVLEEVETYILTFKASWQDNVNGGIQVGIDFYNNNDDLIASLTRPVANNELELQTLTIPTPSLHMYSYSEIKFIIGDTAESGGNYICARLGEVKLEKGEIYTGWRGSKKDEATIIYGENLITNGDFSSYTLPKTIDGWKVNGDGWIWDLMGQAPYNKPGCIYFAHTSVEDVYSGFFQRVYNLKKRTEYTLTFYIGWENNVRDFYVDLVFQDESNTSILPPVDLKPSQSGTYSYTFVTPGIDFHSMNVGFCHRGEVEDLNGGLLGIAGNVELIEKNYIEDLGTLLLNYTTKTELEQTNQDFTFKIQQAGGYNLIRNSTGDGGLKGWVGDTDNSTYFMMNIEEPNPKISPNGYAFGYRNVSTTTERFSHSPRFALKPNTTYTLSAWVHTQQNVSSLEIHILGSESLQGTDSNAKAYDSKHIYTLINIYTGGAWQYVTKTFTTKDGIKSGFIRVDHNGLKMNTTSYVNIYWTSLMLTEGSIALPWSPHPSEIYDGIVKIDKNGLTIQHNNSKSVLDSEALKFYDGNNLYSRIEDGKFRFTDSNGVKLGDVGYSWWKEAPTKALARLYCSYGHSLALSTPYSADSGIAAVGVVHSSHTHWVDGDTLLYQGVNIAQPTICGPLKVKPYWDSTMQEYTNSYVGHLNIWGNNNSNYGAVGNIAGNEVLYLCVMSGSTPKTALAIYEDANYSGGVRLSLGGPLQMNGWSMMNARSTMDLNAQSRYTKSLLSEGTNEHISYGTLSYSDNEIRWCCKENVFTYQDCDIDPETDEWVYLDRYICYIELPIFMAENIEADYHINVSKMSWGDWRIREKNQYYFILESKENDFAFTFEVVAKLKDGSTIDTNAYVANDSVSEVNIELPQDFKDLEIPMDNLQENIITEEGES